MVDDESSKADEREKRLSVAPEREHGFGEFRKYVPREILDVSFPASVRGYDRRAVDAYVKRVNRVIAELKVSASPPAAVRHALDQAEEKVEALLQAAREAAEELTASARQEAEESTARVKAEAAQLVVSASSEADRMKADADGLIAGARAEADATSARAKAEADELVAGATAEAKNTLARSRAEAEERLRRSQEELAALREQAETRMRELQADTDAIWKKRRELLGDIQAMAVGLVDLVDAAAARIQPREPAAPEEQQPNPDAKTEPPRVATEASTPAPPTPGSQEGRDDQSHEEDRTASGRGT